MYSILSDDKIVQCPYNKCHTMPSSSFQRHLVNCGKNYGQNCKVICPYNATHRLSISEIAEHVKTCPTRRVVEACHIEQHYNPISAKQTNESSFASTIEDNEIEKQIGTFSRYMTYNPPTYNQDDEPEIDDVESLVGSVGMGRGKIFRRDNIPVRLRFLRRGYNS